MVATIFKHRNSLTKTGLSWNKVSYAHLHSVVFDVTIPCPLATSGNEGVPSIEEWAQYTPSLWISDWLWSSVDVRTDL